MMLALNKESSDTPESTNALADDNHYDDDDDYEDMDDGCNAQFSPIFSAKNKKNSRRRWYSK